MLGICLFSAESSFAIILPHEFESKQAILAKNSQLITTGNFSGTPSLDTPSPALTARKDGYYQFFTGYGIWYNPFLGANEVHGKILEKWRSLNFESGPLGFPTTDELPVPGNSQERYNAFENGYLSTTPIGIRWFDKINDEMPGSHTLMVNVDNVKINDDHEASGPGQWDIVGSIYSSPKTVIKYIHINDYGASRMGLDSAMDGMTYSVGKAQSLEVPPNGTLRVQITGTEIDGQIDSPDSKKADCFGQACPESDDELLGEIVQDFDVKNNYGIGRHCDKSSVGDYDLCYHITEVGYDLDQGTNRMQLISSGCTQKNESTFGCNISERGDIHEIACSGNILIPTDIRAKCSTDNGIIFLCNFYGEMIDLRCSRP
jgi:hypothetical protein